MASKVAAVMIEHGVNETEAIRLVSVDSEFSEEADSRFSEEAIRSAVVPLLRLFPPHLYHWKTKTRDALPPS
jgi:hypothetical protein